MKTKISSLGNDCCGCAACVQRCPKHCISLHERSEGFLFPQVDEENCVGCASCEKACPILNTQDKLAPLQVLAVKNRNEQERMDSSSGGVFLPLARDVINRGGLVFGAVYDEAWEVHHVYTETEDGLRPMMCSKYMQSRIENSYQKAESFLKRGREVMFVGTPCQIAGLKSYLRHKDYPNLLAVDFLCHGTPSPGVWRRYIAEGYGGYEHVSNQKSSDEDIHDKHVKKNEIAELRAVNANLPIDDIKFRDKSESGWGKYHLVVTRNNLDAGKNTIWTSDIHTSNLYLRGFVSDIYLRPSCYACKCKNGASHSDLTIGDFWGIDNIAPDFNDDKGVGIALVNTPKGQEYFNRLDMETLPASLEAARRFNGGFNEHTKSHPKRNLFFEMIEQGVSVETAVETCLRVPWTRRLAGKLKRMIKMVVGEQ